jgi:hypothetical protein
MEGKLGTIVGWAIVVVIVNAIVYLYIYGF